MKKASVFLLLTAMSAQAETWNSDNDPRNFDSNYNYHFNSLPLKAELPLSKTPWAGSFWPRNKGSINYRWNTSNPTGFNIKSPSRSRVQIMSTEELAQLSPAEKFDLAQGHYHYPLSTSVAKGSKKTAKDFEGVCDGWTASAIQFAEPAPVAVKNPDGIQIPFGTADVKALMSYDVSINAEKGSLGSVFVGGYCVLPWFVGGATSKCQDINPGAFHVILANQIGLKQESFAVDIDPQIETWNQPVYGFEFEVRGMTTSPHSTYAYIVHAKFKYAEDDLEGEEVKKIFSWEPTVGTANYAGTYREYDYILEVNRSGNIIGGTWLGESKRNHPDLFWMPTKKIKFTKEFEALNDIYKPNFL